MSNPYARNNPKLEWMTYKAKLERKWRAGDEDAGKELHAIIVEETGLLYQKPRGTLDPKERLHLDVMKKLFNKGDDTFFTKADWLYITSGQVKPMYTRSAFGDDAVAATG